MSDMNIIKRLDIFTLNESSLWQEGQWVVQRHPDFNIWMLLISKQKNGGWTAITMSDESGGRNKAAKQSIKGAYPAPEPTKITQVPPKIKADILKKAGQLNIVI